jgi:cell filamentation protein
MPNNTKISIRFFDDREVRAVWDEENSKAVDISANTR